MNATATTGVLGAAPVPGVRTSWQERKAIAYPVFALVALLLIIPATLHGPLLYNSFPIDWVWADQFTAELANGNPYPRWLPLSYGGLGAPVFYYYPPLAFYAAAMFGLAGFSTYGSVIATFALAFAASGATCWHWLRGRSAQPLFGAIFFMAAPYHFLDYVMRGALAETVAVALIPLLMIGFRAMAERRGGVALSAVAYAALICTHLPLALLVSLLLVVPYSLWHRHALGRFAVALSIGLMLSALYLAPALALERFHDVGQLYRTPNLRPGYWSLWAGNWADPSYVMVFGAIAALAFATSLALLWQPDRWALYAFAVILLVAGVVPQLWSLPLIRQVQFPYRALPLAEFALATALARWGSIRGLAAGIAPLLLTLTWLPGLSIPNEELARLQRFHPDVYEYLPRGVMRAGETSASLKDVLGSRIPPPNVPGMVVEPHFYFPSWSCGQSEPRTHLLMHRPDCSPSIVMTMPERIGAAISLAGLLLSIAGLLMGRRQRRGPPLIAASTGFATPGQ